MVTPPGAVLGETYHVRAVAQQMRSQATYATPDRLRGSGERAASAA